MQPETILEPLNPRETEILALIADGLSNREIAQRIHLSLETVKWYNKQIFAKLGAASRTQAVSIAEKNQLIPSGQPPSPSNAALPAAASEHPDGALPTGSAGALKLLSQLARGQMVGRKSEIGQLREIWARVLQGNGHLALISGEPGIGKTRLASEMILSAQLGGAAVLHGGCYEYEATTPYLPFAEAFREWVHRHSREDLQATMGDTAGELAKLAPEIESKMGSLPPVTALSASEERLRLFDNVTRFLHSLAEEQGLLLFIDDLHWADQSTLALLAYALRNLRGEKVMILAAYREVELDRSHPLAPVLVEWNRERIVTRFSLGRLTFEETSELIAVLFGQETISEELTRALYAETEGNPFFIEEVIKALIEQGQIYRENNQWERKDISELVIPQSVKEAVGRRLSRLSDPCLEVLHTAAALGKEFDFAEIAAVSPVDEDALLDALDEASAAQLVRSKSSDTFAFTHDKIREVLYEEINPIRRKRLHQRIGEALEKDRQQGKHIRVQDLAYHFTESGDLSRSLEYSIAAAQKASHMFALDDALYYYKIAHDAAESLKQTEQLKGIDNAIGDIHSQRGQVNLSVEAYQRALALEANPEERAAIQARMGSVYISAGAARGLPMIEAALQELNRQTQAEEVALATAMIGRYYDYQAFHSKAIEYLEQARIIAEPLDRAETLSEIYAYLAGAYQHLTRFPESSAWARKNIELGERKNHPINEAYGYEFLAENSFSTGQWRAALEYAERDREIGKRIGAQDRIAWANYSESTARHGLGDLQAAEKAALATRSLAQNIGDTRLVILAGGLLVQIYADLGNFGAATLLGQQLLVETDELKHVVIQTDSRRGVAYVQLQQNQTGNALELFTQAEELINRTENLWIKMRYRPWMAQALVDAGRLDQAAEIAESAVTLGRRSGARYIEGLALRVQAQIQAAAGDWEAALDTIHHSIAILAETETRLEWGRSVFMRGKIHQGRGDTRTALADWDQALETFTRLGAVPDARKVDAQIRAVA